MRFPEGDHFFEDNAFHWRALLSDPRLAYVATPVVAHTVGDARQTTAGIDGDDSEKLAGHFPNLDVIARELLEERAPAHLLREFANFLSRSKWVVTRQRDAHLRAKFARVLQRTARAFVAAASTFSDADLASELEDNAYVTFGADAAPLLELSVVIPTKDVGATQITDLLAALTRVPLATEIIVVDDGSTDDTVAAVEKFREHHANVYLLRDAVSRGAGRARNRAAPLLEGAFTVYVDADDAVDPQALAAAVRGLPDGADLLFFPYAIDQRSKTRSMWAVDQKAYAAGRAAMTADARKNAALALTNYPWNRVARTKALDGVQFGATRVHNDVRFHWGSISASRDVAFLKFLAGQPEYLPKLVLFPDTLINSSGLDLLPRRSKLPMELARSIWVCDEYWSAAQRAKILQTLSWIHGWRFDHLGSSAQKKCANDLLRQSPTVTWATSHFNWQVGRNIP